MNSFSSLEVIKECFLRSGLFYHFKNITIEAEEIVILVIFAHQESVGLMLSSILSIEESVERVDSLERSRQLRWIRENS